MATTQQKPMAISSITSPLNLGISSSSPSSPILSSSATFLPENQHRHHIHHHFNHYQRESYQHKSARPTANNEDHASSMTNLNSKPNNTPTLSQEPHLNQCHNSSSSCYSNSVGAERSPSPLLHSTGNHDMNSNDNSSNSSSGGSTNGSSGDEHGSSSSSSDPTMNLSSSSSSSSPGNSTGLLSLQERRQRNKTASAKYRAKKNQQHHDMRSVIHSLTKENDVLIRQLEQVKTENQQLKSTCDKLRGKMMAEKMLKKMLHQQQQQQYQETKTPSMDAGASSLYQKMPSTNADQMELDDGNDSSDDHDPHNNGYGS